MKKILFFLLALASSQFLFAQAPQGINYQAVAMNASGAIANKNISLRLSIVDSIATGNLLYTETHNTTTDPIGSFSVVIGNGTITLGNFSSINWGKNYKWLKTEIDTLGGSSFVVMGITQFMSTPYALFANKTKDITDLMHPDGLSKSTTIIVGTSNYTVPLGKNLYCTSVTNDYLIYSGDTCQANNFCLGEGKSFKFLNGNNLCYLLDKTVKWSTFDLVTTSITPPTGKTFIIASVFRNYNGFVDNTGAGFSSPTILLNSQPTNFEFFTLNSIPFVLSSGSTLSATINTYTGKLYISGYFIDN